MLLYENTVEIGVGNPNPRFQKSTFHRLLQDLGEADTKFKGIAEIALASSQVVHVTFLTAAEAIEFLRKHSGVSPRLLEGKLVQVVIRDPNIAEKYIRISDFPVSGNLEIVKTRLREFGTVLGLRRERYRASDEYFDCYTGVIIARMSLVKDIPNYLDVGPYKTYVRYQGQPTTCRVCNLTGHLGANCPKTNSKEKARTLPLPAPQPAPLPPRQPPIPPGVQSTPPQDAVDPALDSTGFPPLPEKGGQQRHTPTPEPTPTEPTETVSIEETPTEREPEQLALAENSLLSTLSVPTPQLTSQVNDSQENGGLAAATQSVGGDDRQDASDLEVDSEEEPDPEGELSSPSPTHSEMEAGGGNEDSSFPTQSGRVAAGTLPTKRPKIPSEEEIQKGWTKAERKRRKKNKKI